MNKKIKITIAVVFTLVVLGLLSALIFSIYSGNESNVAEVPEQKPVVTPVPSEDDNDNEIKEFSFKINLGSGREETVEITTEIPVDTEYNTDADNRTHTIENGDFSMEFVFQPGSDAIITNNNDINSFRNTELNRYNDIYRLEKDDNASNDSEFAWHYADRYYEITLTEDEAEYSFYTGEVDYSQPFYRSTSSIAGYLGSDENQFLGSLFISCFGDNESAGNICDSIVENIRFDELDDEVGYFKTKKDTPTRIRLEFDDESHYVMRDLESYNQGIVEITVLADEDLYYNDRLILGEDFIINFRADFRDSSSELREFDEETNKVNYQNQTAYRSENYNFYNYGSKLIEDSILCSEGKDRTVEKCFDGAIVTKEAAHGQELYVYLNCEAETAERCDEAVNYLEIDIIELETIQRTE